MFDCKIKQINNEGLFDCKAKQIRVCLIVK